MMDLYKDLVAKVQESCRNEINGLSNSDGMTYRHRFALAILIENVINATAREAIAMTKAYDVVLDGAVLSAERVSKIRREILLEECDVLSAQPPAVSVPDGYAQGIEAVAKMLEKKADDYACQFGHDDMGSLSFGGGKNAECMRDYHSGLTDLAEEVRAMLATAPQATAEDSSAVRDAVAAEREACAEVAESYANKSRMALMIAAVIRARGEE